MIPNRPPDITINELEEEDYPASRWCEGAKHAVPADAEYQGKPIRFFLVSGRGVPKPIVICQPCLVVANAMAQKQKRFDRIMGGE